MFDLSNKILSVSEFNAFIKDLLKNLGTFKIQGEITEINISKNKGLNLTLSDGKANLRIGGYAPSVIGIDLVEKSMEVIVTGFADLYPAYGSFSVSALKIEPVGQGALAIAYEKLKEKLEREGLFAEENKHPLNKFVKNIALITAENSAAFSDFTKILLEHSSSICINFYPVLVQGEKSEQSILSALKHCQKDKLDAIVLIRGGGSLEDLKTFNSEQIARAIFASKIPVIVGVGHEKDESIADFVADLRASTPSQAAYYILAQNQKLIDSFQSKVSLMSNYLMKKIDNERNNCNSNIKRIYSILTKTISDYTEKVILINSKCNLFIQSQKEFIIIKSIQKLHYIESNLISKISSVKNKIHRIKQNLFEKIQFDINLTKNNIFEIEKRILAYDKVKMLKRGYALVQKQSKQVARKKDLSKGDLIKTIFYDGAIKSKITSVN